MKKLQLSLQADRDKLIHTTLEVIGVWTIGFLLGMLIVWMI